MDTHTAVKVIQCFPMFQSRDETEIAQICHNVLFSSATFEIIDEYFILCLSEVFLQHISIG